MLCPDKKPGLYRVTLFYLKLDQYTNQLYNNYTLENDILYLEYEKNLDHTY